MNKKAASFAPIGVAFMVGLVLIIFALGIAPAVNQGVDIARNTDNLNCSNSSISIFDKATCVASDSSQFVFIGGLLFLAFAIIAGARRLY